MTEQSGQNVTTKRKRGMSGWIALGITVAIVASLAFQIDDWGRDWTQNSASLDSDAVRPELRPVVLQSDVAETVKQIRDWADEQSKWDVASSQVEGTEGRLALTRTTPLWKFVDDITVTVTPDPAGGGAVVNASSQSRVGKGDLGQNPRNLIELTSALR